MIPKKLSNEVLSTLDKFAIISVSDINGVINYVNNRFIETSGYSYEEIIGNTHNILNSRFHKSDYFKELWETVLSGKNFHGLNRNKAKDGSFFWIDAHIYPLFDDNNEVDSFLTVNYPVNELRKDDKHWRESSIQKALLNEFLTQSVNIKDYNALFENAIELILSSPFSSLLPSGGIFLVENGNLILKYHKNLHPEIIRQCSVIKKNKCHCGMAFKTGRVVYTSNVDHKHTVTYKEMKDHGHYNVPIIYQGEVIGVIVVYLPANHKKQGNEIIFLESMANALALSIERIRNAKNLIKEKTIAENALISNTKYINVMSHEIRTPLNGIVGISNLLNSGSIKDSNEIKSMLKTLNYSANNLMTLVNDVLDHAKLESGKMDFENIEFNFDDFTNELNNTFQPKCNEKGIDFRIKKDSNIPKYIKGDPIRLNQVILNITNNAIKFTEKGHVEFAASISTSDDNKIVIKFEITDTGIGISKENMSKVFEQFQQAESSTARKYGGTGLGLSIAKQIVELQNSEIKIKSKLGEGTTFYFDLKFEIVERNETKKLFDIKNANLNNLKILVAEDNAVNALIARKFLEMWNSNATFVINGKEALNELESNNFDVILMDIQMPIMDGLEATKAIKLNPRLSQIPVLALTASRSGKETFLANNPEFDNYIPKPFIPEEFFNTIINSYNNSKKT